MTISLVAIFAATVLVRETVGTVCPEQCRTIFRGEQYVVIKGKCEPGGTVLCNGRGLSKIPLGIPPDTVRLDLQENRITLVRRHDLAALQQLKILQLADNRLESIDEGAFDALDNLERVRLNRNRLRSLPDKVFARNRFLHRLDLSDNFLSTLSDDQLRGPRAMRTLQLERNLLTCLETSVLSSWRELEVLNLQHNNLTTLAEFELPAMLRHFRLHDNPWLCDCRVGWLKRAVSAGGARCHSPALLHERPLDGVANDWLKCSGIERRSSAAGCRPSVACPSMCACTETTVDCRDRALTHVPANLPPTTTELRLEQNRISFIPPRAFHGLPRLQGLDLSRNVITEISPRAFEGLSQLNSLVLYGNQLTELPEDIFEGLESLQILLLNGNKLRCVRTNTFKGLSNLTLLSLYDNAIRSMADGTLHGLGKLTTLHLAKNPLICDCNLEWLANILYEKNIETTGAKCKSPKRMARRLMSEQAPSKFRCKEDESLVTVSAGRCEFYNPCPANCSCRGGHVKCSQMALTSIPANLPLHTTHLELTHNAIGEIPSNAFKGLARLQHLDLSHNKIRHISNGGFASLPLLEFLQLSHNNLLNFSAHTAFSGPHLTLQTLDLSHNAIGCISNYTFSGLPALKALRLNDNRVAFAAANSFSSLFQLSSLSLGSNPWLCDCAAWRLANLLGMMSADLEDMTVCQAPKALHGRSIMSITKEEVVCSDAEHSARCTPDGSYCPSGCVCEGKSMQCSKRGFTEIPHALPLDVEHLKLDGNHIKTIDIERISALTRLRTIDLSDNRLIAIEARTFASNSQLETIVLSKNSIRCLSPDSFVGLDNLKSLQLDGNDLAEFEPAVLEPFICVFSKLAANPLHCGCDFSWLHSVEFRGKLTDAPLCQAPAKLEGKLLIDGLQVDKCSTEAFANDRCDACAKSPCQNGAVCSRGIVCGRSQREISGSTGLLSFQCACTPGWYGNDCSREIDACYAEPCVNGGKCKALDHGRFSCSCHQGFEGTRCERDIDECRDNPCANGATCVDGINTFTCQCPPQLTGKHCDVEVQFCSNVDPCLNGGRCERLEDKRLYVCHCRAGWIGQNCEVAPHECHADRCENGGICLQSPTGFQCLCSSGFSGQFCQVAPKSNALFLIAGGDCSPATCQNGRCIASADSQSQACECREGFGGAKCTLLRSIGLSRPDARVQFGAWKDANHANVTLLLRTVESAGILIYHHSTAALLSVELFDGRLKIGFHAGNLPASYLYSFSKVNDGRAHRVELLISGRKLTLQVDEAPTQSIENFGKVDRFEPDPEVPLFFGGLPEEIGRRALTEFHIKQLKSFKGCLSDLHMNSEQVDFSSAEKLENIDKGCSSTIDFCFGVEECGAGGSCQPNPDVPKGYSCRCGVGWTGDRCEIAEPVKNAECVGWCGGSSRGGGGDENDAIASSSSLSFSESSSSQCCRAVKVKMRRLKMHCKGPNGSSSTRFLQIPIVRRCQCALPPSLSANSDEVVVDAATQNCPALSSQNLYHPQLP